MSTDPTPSVFDAAYLGGPGSYSEHAAELLVGRAARTLPLPSLSQVVAAVTDGRARAAVVPVENSVAGTVPEAYELLLDNSLTISRETLVAIDHVLVAPSGTEHANLRRVLSHSVALAQCRGFFRRHPEIEAIPASDTANAVARVVAEADGRSAAIASRRAAALCDAVVLEENIQDDPDNWTRFLLLEPEPATAPSPGVLRKALVVFALPHTPGALARALAPLGERQLNLTRIESRALRGRPFEYQFIAELAIPPGLDFDAVLDAVRDATAWLRLVGVYASTSEQLRARSVRSWAWASTRTPW